MPHYLVKFTQVSHHKVQAHVVADSPEEAKIKARAGDSENEFDITEPESWELKEFFAKQVTQQEATEWTQKNIELMDTEKYRTRKLKEENESRIVQ